MPLPTVDFELVRRLEEAASAFGIARLEALRDGGASALDLRIERFGSVVAPASPAAPELDFVNRIERLEPAEAGRLPEILAFYGALGIDPWLELAPHPDLDELGRALAAAGARTTGFHAVVYAEPDARAGSAVPVRTVERGDEKLAAARVLLGGLGAPVDALDTDAPALVAATERASGTLYLATLDGSPAAAAILTVTDGAGYLALAATLPAFRRRGCQAALIAARVADAHAAGCDVTSSGTTFGSESQRNLERAGFRVAYTKPVLRLESRRAGGEATPAA